MTPSLASRPAFFAAEACPFLRRISTAASKSPFASASAFLQSIKPAFVISRSLPTELAVISAINFGYDEQKPENSICCAPAYKLSFEFKPLRERQPALQPCLAWPHSRELFPPARLPACCGRTLIR